MYSDDLPHGKSVASLSSNLTPAGLIYSTVSLLLLAAFAGGRACAETGSAACAPCHATVFASYMRTPMALSSGRTGSGSFAESFERGEFSHAPSGIRYRVHPDEKKPSFDFDLTDTGLRIQGSRPLQYFVGSGTVGRSYLFSIDRFLYQAPVSYYSAAQKWDLSPGYHNYDRLHLTRPVEPACLRCHASQVQPVPGTLNGFADPPFVEGGISCERCHGPGEAHIAKTKAGTVVGGLAIVNPRKLPPPHRDSVCAQCHLTGVARIDKPGRNSGAFRAGELLSDSISVFVWSGVPAEMKVTSHFEKLAQSRCKIESGDRLWCGSCHDPHSLPTPNETASYFRNKCLACHSGTAQCKASAQARARNGNRCVDCHMPKNPVTDVAHAVYTDHSIPRRAPARAREAVSSKRVLTPFGSSTASDRDLGLAYAFVLEGERNPDYEARAFHLLSAAVAQAPHDIPALVQLADLYGYRGEEDQAITFYERAVRADPTQVVAAANLGTYLMKKGRADEAMRLWSDVLARSPGLEIARMNLALARRLAGDLKSAEQTLNDGLSLNPGATEMRRLLNQLRQPVPR
jgi:predicted CXXCH cytochrome family protein